MDLEQYFEAKGTLHCTTKFCDYGKAEGAKEYAQIPVRNLSKLFAHRIFFAVSDQINISLVFVGMLITFHFMTCIHE